MHEVICRLYDECRKDSIIKEGKTWVYVSNGGVNGWIRTDLIK